MKKRYKLLRCDKCQSQAVEKKIYCPIHLEVFELECTDCGRTLFRKNKTKKVFCEVCAKVRRNSFALKYYHKFIKKARQE